MPTCRWGMDHMHMCVGKVNLKFTYTIVEERVAYPSQHQEEPS